MKRQGNGDMVHERASVNYLTFPKRSSFEIQIREMGVLQPNGRNLAAGDS